MNKAIVAIGIFGLVYWYLNGGVEKIGRIGSSETSIPSYDLPNMKTKVPAGANNDHIWLVKG